MLGFWGILEFPEYPKISLPKKVKRPVESISDVDKIRVPDPLKSETITRRMDFTKKIVVDGSKAAMPSGSPMGLVESMTGLPLLLRWFAKEKSAVHKLLRDATDYLKEIIDVYVETFGADNCSTFSSFPIESQELISPDTFAEFSVPYIIEVHEYLLEKGVDNWSLHLCGNHKENLKFWKNDIPLAKNITLALDPKIGNSILKLLKQVNEELGITIIVVTHQMEAIKQICDKVAILDQGKIVADGPVKEIFLSNPKGLQNLLGIEENPVQNGHASFRFIIENIDQKRFFNDFHRETKVEYNFSAGGIEKFKENNCLLGEIDVLQEDKKIVEEYFDKNKIMYEVR